MRTKLPDPVDVHVGRRVKMRRMMLDLSQSDLGKKSRITFQQIQKYEKGVNRVSASRLQEFSKCLGVPVSFFFEGLSSNGAKLKNAPEDPAQQLLVTRDGIDLVKAFVSIDDKALRRSIVTMVEEIANGKVSTASARRRISAVSPNPRLNHHQVPRDVCFTPESRHGLALMRCPLSARSGHCFTLPIRSPHPQAQAPSSARSAQWHSRSSN